MDWYREVQFVAAVPMPEDWAREYGTTVNGMWDDPRRWDRSRVEQAHSEGRRVLVSVPLIALTSRAYEGEESRHLLGEVCRDIHGDEAEVGWYYWDEKPVYSVCIYSDVFRDFLLQKCRAAAAEGIDVISVDEIQTSIGLMSRKPRGSGFCPRCLEVFCTHLEESDDARREAGVESVGDLRRDEYALLLRRLREEDDFYRQYVDAHSRAAFHTVREFLSRLRAICAEGGQDGNQAAVTANLTGIGTFLETQGSLWGAMWGELLDFVLMENVYLIDPGAFHEGPAHKLLPRGKFTAWYRLASSFSSQAPSWVCPQINVPKQLAGQKSLNYYLLMFLESYANNGRWGYYWAPGLDEKTRLATTVPEAIKDYTQFILDHRGHYEGCQTANDILIIYADSAVFANPKGHFKYLALAQALAEVNYQYDVMYAGDDLFAPGDLDRDALDRHRIVLLPEAGHLTDQQIDVLSSYAEAGGQVVAFSESALKGRPGVATIADERLLDFWRHYRDEDRTRAVAPLVDLGHDPVRVSDPTVNVIGYAKGKTRILHVLNYDYREADDSIEARHEVEIDIPWQEAAAPDVVWLTLEGENGLQSRVDGNRLVFTVPKVDPYGLAIIG